MLDQLILPVVWVEWIVGSQIWVVKSGLGWPWMVFGDFSKFHDFSRSGISFVIFQVSMIFPEAGNPADSWANSNDSSINNCPCSYQSFAGSAQTPHNIICKRVKEINFLFFKTHPHTKNSIIAWICMDYHVLAHPWVNCHDCNQLCETEWPHR